MGGFGAWAAAYRAPELYTALKHGRNLCHVELKHSSCLTSVSDISNYSDYSCFHLLWCIAQTLQVVAVVDRVTANNASDQRLYRQAFEGLEAHTHNTQIIPLTHRGWQFVEPSPGRCRRDLSCQVCFHVSEENRLAQHTQLHETHLETAGCFSTMRLI